MLGKASTVATIFVLSSSCFSNSYIGATIGPEQAMFTRIGHVVGSTVPVDAFNKNHFAGFGEFGSIFAGYEFRFKRFYLAGEFNANLSSVKYELVDSERFSGSFEKTTYTVRDSEGFGILPGFFLFDCTLFYARLGVANGRIDINLPEGLIPSSHARRTGFRYGLGIRHRLSSRWVAMMEYSQINYQGIDSSLSLPNFGIDINIKFIPNTAQAAFGLLYQFDTPHNGMVKEY